MKLTARLTLLTLATLIVGGGIAATAGGSDDPVGNFNFIVEIEGLEACPVAFVDGIRSGTDVVEYRSGADRAVHKLPGRHHVGNIVLRRGVTSDASWWEWRKAIVDGEPGRRSVSIRVLDATRADAVLDILATRAWPAAYRIAPLDASDSQALVEEIELVVESIDRAG